MLLLAARPAAADPLVDRLANAGDDARMLDAAVARIEAAEVDADALLAAGRACEDRLADPARALRLYERLLAAAPDTRAAVTARRLASGLRAELGAAGDHAAEARELAQLVADADALPAADVDRRADALAARAWPGAPAAALWLANWQQRAERCPDARPRFDAIVARWPDTPAAIGALRGAARCALDAHAWSEAEALAARLPVAVAADRIVQADLAHAAARGRLRDRLVIFAWLVIVAVVGGLGLAVARATRGQPLRARLRPPLEALYLAPVVGVLIAIARLATPASAPAIALIALGGFVLATLSGATLAARRAAGHPVRARGLVQAAACALAVVALVFIALLRTDLLDQLMATLRTGPE